MIHLIFQFRFFFLEDKTPPIKWTESMNLHGCFQVPTYNIIYTRRFKYFVKLDTGRYFYDFFFFRFDVKKIVSIILRK
jgi:hypothetical protein